MAYRSDKRRYVNSAEVADIMDQGIILAGGGAMLANLDVRIREVTALPVIVAPDPLISVANGAGAALESLDLLRRVTQPA